MRPSSPPWRRGIAPAALALLLSACTHDLTEPAQTPSESPRGAVATTTTDQPRFISNAVKYRDAGARPATGRSGSSSLAVRALLGSDGVTQLEVTTGSFDGVAAPSPLAKVQVKQLEAGGGVLRTLNYNNLSGGGTATFSYTGLARGQKLQVQANVSEPKRTAVVTVTEAVRLRPDLRVRLEAPADAMVGVPVTLLATVSEGNGDVGARTDCVLYVDGVEADRARAIWVDAGDQVTCAFLHTFASAGDHALRVAAENVSPADFDPANNVAEGTIHVGAQRDRRFSYYASAEDYREQSVQLDSAWNLYDDGRRTLNVQTLTQTTRTQNAQLNGWTPHGVSRAATQIRVSQSTGGVVVHSGFWPNALGHEYGPVSGELDCMSRWSSGALFYLCSTGTPDNGFTSFQYLRFGTAVTYYSVTHTSFWYPDAPDNAYTYSFDQTTVDASGQPQITVGPDYRFQVELMDGPRTYRADATVALGPVQTSTWTFYRPSGRRCSTQRFDEFAMRLDICRYHRAEITKRNGFVNYQAVE
ncbi:MAG TPA: hypothetical protein VFJ82_22505 [Longimicrobium sp.]|nr:hypothetical protein [Longimicrobium sp.]